MQWVTTNYDERCNEGVFQKSLPRSGACMQRHPATALCQFQHFETVRMTCQDSCELALLPVFSVAGRCARVFR